MSDRSRSVTPVDDHRAGPAPLPDAGPAPFGGGDAPPNPNQIEIKVHSDGGGAIHVKIKKTTKMSKVMQAWSAKEGKAPDTLRYFFDGQRLREDDTPEGLEMENGDMIEVFAEQTGGGLASLV